MKLADFANKMQEGSSVLVDDYSTVSSLKYDLKQIGFRCIYRKIYLNEKNIYYRVWKVEKENWKNLNNFLTDCELKIYKGEKQ